MNSNELPQPPEVSPSELLSWTEGEVKRLWTELKEAQERIFEIERGPLIESNFSERFKTKVGRYPSFWEKDILECLDVGHWAHGLLGAMNITPSGSVSCEN